MFLERTSPAFFTSRFKYSDCIYLELYNFNFVSENYIWCFGLHSTSMKNAVYSRFLDLSILGHWLVFLIISKVIFLAYVISTCLGVIAVHGLSAQYMVCTVHVMYSTACIIGDGQCQSEAGCHNMNKSQAWSRDSPTVSSRKVVLRFAQMIKTSISS